MSRKESESKQQLRKFHKVFPPRGIGNSADRRTIQIIKAAHDPKPISPAEEKERTVHAVQSVLSIQDKPTDQPSTASGDTRTPHPAEPVQSPPAAPKGFTPVETNFLQRLDIRPFWIPKKGNELEEYEDAFCVTNTILAKSKGVRFAVADGASEASFSRIWAAQLVRAFVRGRINFPISLEQLQPIQKRWNRFVHRRPLAWYAEEKLQSGAFASLLCLELSKDEDLRRAWHAAAVGDSCLVQVSDDQVASNFPLGHSASFSNRVTLLSSNPQNNEGVADQICEMRGSWKPGDTFYLMTDAISAWFFKEVERGNRPWVALRNLDNPDIPGSCSESIDELRIAGELKNDDVTVLRIQIRE